MTCILTITGRDAITLGLASNRQPQLLHGTLGWVHASNLAQAVRMCNIDPNTVRLMADARVLAEDILHQTIMPDIAPDALLALMEPHDEDPPLTREAISALRGAYAAQAIA